MTVEKYVTVSALTKYIKRKFDYDPHLRDMYIKGEISNFKQHSSGHMYFTLKDERARISAVMFSSSNQQLVFKPENGMKVLIRGEISVFEQSGNYQVYVREMHPDGVGDLFVAFQQLKEQLEKEGLFLEDHKQSIPPYPTTIGVITSPTGAAVRDIITTLKRRYPMGRVLMYPALVQGPQAPDSIVKAINQANANSEIDVLIVGRGGGSLEELWAFNEEKVARAIYHSKIPIISAVGHETDTTIADFVSDMRAATPTAAAELAVPHIVELKKLITLYVSKLTTFVTNELKQKELILSRLDKSYAFRYPEKLYEQKVEQFDRVFERMQKENQRFFERKKEQVEQLHQALVKFHPSDRIHSQQENIQKLEKQINRSMKMIIQTKQQCFSSTLSKLGVLNPLNIMERGYSIAFDESNHVIKSQIQVNKGDTISVVLKDGQLVCEVKDCKEGAINE
ncbi:MULTISPECIES: exodeoxyribonuclease VII large subunit [Bacillus]|uniref:exodeoxyribonuclease VII large subunit n=1 Tax=Bacillus TaxID=1386 RepID=UPI00031FD2C5|nr:MULTISPECIES: exodeoxyribonuclease VII large subunit [Bacillus]